MGKRELLLIGAFAVVAMLAYQFTAPPAKDGEQGFSISRIFGNIKKEMTANSKSATINKSGTLALSKGVTELRLTALRVVPLTVIGERRDDIAYEMTVQSTGPDEATAREYAERSKIVQDDLGEEQTLVIDFPKEGQQTAKLTLRVPTRLLIRFENSGRVTVSDVRAVDLRNLAGETTISNVSGQVSGSHRSGDLSVSRVGAVELAMSNSQAKFTGIEGVVMLKGRNGDCVIADARGPITTDTVNADLTITNPGGGVRVSGEGGNLRLDSPAQEFKVDVRRMLVEVQMATVVAATVITSSQPLRLTLGSRPGAAGGGAPGVIIDAAATDGKVRASDFGLTPTDQASQSRLAAPIGGGGPKIVMRNTSADIVISLRK